MTSAIDTPEGTTAPAEEKKPKKQGSGLGKYILVRFLLIFPTMFILLTMVFFLMRITGDPITASLAGRLPPDALQARVAEAGYDRPVIVQYFEYLGNILQGDFGTTISTNTPVTSVLVNYGTATLELVFYALIVAFIIGIPLGLIAAYKRDHWQDAALRFFAILCYATPIFFLGLLLKLVFSVWLGWLPVSGRTSYMAELEGLQAPTGIYLLDALRAGNMTIALDVLEHAALPAIALGLLVAGIFLRLVRTNVIGTLGANFVEAGRSRGTSEYRLLTKHAYKPALIPIVTVMGLQIAMLMGGAVLTETTFGWRGLGYQLAEFLTARDFVAVQGIVMLLAIIVAVTNFLVDIIAALIDPRVRY